MAVQNSLVAKNQKQTFSAFLATDAMKKKVNEMVGGEKGQQFVTAIISAVSANPQLAECDNASIVSSFSLSSSFSISSTSISSFNGSYFFSSPFLIAKTFNFLY